MGADRIADERLDEETREDRAGLERRELASDVGDRETEHQERAGEQQHQTDEETRDSPRKRARRLETPAEVAEQAGRRTRTDVPHDESERVQHHGHADEGCCPER